MMFRLKFTCTLIRGFPRLLRLRDTGKIRVQCYSKDAFKQLLQRGVIQEVMPPDNEEVLNLFASKQCIYCGFDPTADSLHVGNLLAIVLMLHMQRMGHEVVAVIGDCTAQIGDPSGRLTERDQMEQKIIEKNVAGLRDNLEAVFKHHEQHFWKREHQLIPLRIVKNSEWYNGQSVVPFIGAVGRHFRLGKMMTRTSVQQRLNSGEGISFAEFSYQMFQSFDWLYLYDKYNCRFQIGGGDQLGNIDSGHDFVKRTRTKDVYGILTPLVTAETGDKYGKSAGNAVWLNAEKTTPYDFYQFFFRLSDKEAIKFVKLFTFTTQKELDGIIEKQMSEPEKRAAQKLLARDMTLLVHGDSGLSLAKNASEVLFGSKPEEALQTLEEQDLRLIFGKASYAQLAMEPGTTVLDMAMEAKLFPTKEDALRIIDAGGLYINQRRVSAPSHVLVPGVHVLPNKMTLARVGKKNYCLIKWLM
ncbi:tyrosine--tRNA ligase, mitochondrial-like [Ornithodoros turicata]|uniref:tyrosine--tRNA ligase, mitochondrial-like n=1 Tax=Ornithodoros turicata TaxID=34597 RepID=UPI003139715C